MVTDPDPVAASAHVLALADVPDSPPHLLDLPSAIAQSESDFEDAGEGAMLRRGLAAGRAYYFVVFFAVSAFSAYLNVYLEGIGITPTELGVIGSLTAIVGMVATPLWGAAADARQWHRALLVAATVATGLVSLAFLNVAAFWGAMVVSVLLSIARAPIPIVLDSSVVALVRKAKASYPRQRVWGTIGYSAGALAASWVVASFGFAPLVWLQLVGFTLIGAILSFLLPIERSAERVNYLVGLRVLLGLRHYRGLVVFMIGLGIVTATNVGFGGLYILALGGSAALIGVMFSLVAAVEIPAMLMTDRVTRRLGLRGSMMIAGVGTALLYGLAGIVSTAWLFVVVMLTVGLFTGIVWAAAAPLAMQDTPLQLRATAVGIVMAAFFGAGFAIGGLLGGSILDAVGGGAHYITAAVLMLLAVGYFYFATRAR